MRLLKLQRDHLRFSKEGVRFFRGGEKQVVGGRGTACNGAGFSREKEREEFLVFQGSCHSQSGWRKQFAGRSTSGKVGEKTHHRDSLVGHTERWKLDRRVFRENHAHLSTIFFRSEVRRIIKGRGAILPTRLQAPTEG